MNADVRTRLIGILLLSACAAFAQTGGATLSGTVKNASGTAIPNARITVKNVAASQTVETQADAAGVYTVSNLSAGEYEISSAAEGFAAKTEHVTLAAGAKLTLDLTLSAAGAPSLSDLGFTPAQTKGSAQEQARLDRRSHMLRTHQRLGLITTAPLIATLIASSGAGGHSSSSSGRELHAVLGGVTAGMYLTTAGFAIFAPKVHDTPVRGPIRLHKALAWVHGPGMILTPVLGALAYQQRNRGERVHGIAQAHAPVAVVTSIAYGLAIASVSIKF